MKTYSLLLFGDAFHEYLRGCACFSYALFGQNNYNRHLLAALFWYFGGQVHIFGFSSKIHYSAFSSKQQKTIIVHWPHVDGRENSIFEIKQFHYIDFILHCYSSLFATLNPKKKIMVLCSVSPQ